MLCGLRNGRRTDWARLFAELYDYLIESGRELVGTRDEAIERMLTPRSYMDDFLALLREHYGGAESYFKKLGFSDIEINEIREFLLD